MGTLRKGWLGLGVAAAFWGCGSEPGDPADASTDLRVLHHDAAGGDAAAEAGSETRAARPRT